SRSLSQPPRPSASPRPYGSRREQDVGADARILARDVPQHETQVAHAGLMTDTQPASQERQGAIGVMQVMPAAGTELKVGDIQVTEPNIHAGARHLDQLMAYYFSDAKFSERNRRRRSLGCARWPPSAGSTPMSGSTTGRSSPRRISAQRPPPTSATLQVRRGVQARHRTEGAPDKAEGAVLDGKLNGARQAESPDTDSSLVYRKFPMRPQLSWVERRSSTTAMTQLRKDCIGRVRLATLRHLRSD